MALLSYVDDQTASAEAQVLFKHLRTLMGRVANALRIAAHSPKVAQPLAGFLVAALRKEVSGVLDVRIKTLVILKTSMLNGCSYCVGHNVALGRSLGFTDEDIAAIEGDFRGSDRFTAAEKAAMAWAEYLTERTYRQHPEAMPELKRHFTEAQIVEITMVAGFFNFWNRFVDGLQVDLEPEHMVGNIKKSRVIDPKDYIAFMRDGWWREGALPDAGRTSSAA
jgi:AhpD family alkylhydroperoxidase